MEQRQATLATMTSDTLAREATPGELVSMVIDRLMRSLDDSKTLSPAERDVVLASMYEGEVNNGGHHQFFFNSRGDDAVETRDALARIGSADLLEIYDCALTAFPTGRPARDREKRNDELARWGEKQFKIFERLDSAYTRQRRGRPHSIGTFAPTSLKCRTHGQPLAGTLRSS